MCKSSILKALSSRFKLSNHRFWIFSYKWENFFSCHRVHVKATLNDDRRYYKKWIIDFLRKISSWREISSWLMLKMCALRWLNIFDVSRFDVRQNMMFAMCLDTMFVVFSRMFFYVRDVSRYDVRRVFESVLLLITLTMFFVRFYVKCHVNVIT